VDGHFVEDLLLLLVEDCGFDVGVEVLVVLLVEEEFSGE
jgi:hypothetical protein